MKQDKKTPKNQTSGKLKKDGTRHPSTTGKTNPLVNQANWRTQLQARRIKFDDDQKEIYLTALLEHGQKVLAANTAGVTNQCVLQHLDNDPDFAEIVDHVLEERGRRIVKKLEEQAMSGYTQAVFDKNGDYCGDKQMYETRLREMMLKRFDREYTDRKEVTNLGGGGVLVVPAGQTVEEWTADAAKLRDEMTAAGHIGKPHEG